MKTQSKSGPIRILIVDDHLIVRAGLTTLLSKERDFFVAGCVASGPESLAFLDSHSVDVILLDLRMPKITGLDVLPVIVSRSNPPSVLILSSFDFEEEIYRAAKQGARGYLTKDAARSEIVEAIHKVASGQSHFPSNMAARIAERDARTGLSPRERDILHMISKGLTNKEIGRALAISQFTVRNHVIHILEKLEATDRTEAVSIALQQGILGATV